MPDELAIVGTVAHVGFGVAVAEQVGERGRVDRETYTVGRQLSHQIDAIRMIRREVLAVALVQAADSHVGNLPSWMGS